MTWGSLTPLQLWKPFLGAYLLEVGIGTDLGALKEVNPKSSGKVSFFFCFLVNAVFLCDIPVGHRWA